MYLLIKLLFFRYEAGDLKGSQTDETDNQTLHCAFSKIIIFLLQTEVKKSFLCCRVFVFFVFFWTSISLTTHRESRTEKL